MLNKAETSEDYGAFKWSSTGLIESCSHVVVSLPLSPPPPLRSVTSPLSEFQTYDWRRRCGCDVTASPSIHQRTGALYSASHLRRGQFLHLQTPLEKKKLKQFTCFLILSSFFKARISFPARLLDSEPVLLLQTHREAAAFLDFLGGGSLRSLFIHLIGWAPLLEQKKLEKI